MRHTGSPLAAGASTAALPSLPVEDILSAPDAFHKELSVLQRESQGKGQDTTSLSLALRPDASQHHAGFVQYNKIGSQTTSPEPIMTWTDFQYYKIGSQTTFPEALMTGTHGGTQTSTLTKTDKEGAESNQGGTFWNTRVNLCLPAAW